MEEKELIPKLRKGQDGAFKVLVNNYQNKVMNTCYGFVHNTEDAEDIAQDVFIEIFRSVSAFKEESSLSTWIYRIAVNKSLDFLRKKNRKKRFGLELSISGNERSLFQEAADPNEPHEDYERNERIYILRKAMASLHKNQRIALVLHKIEGLPHQEIANIMNISHSAVESLIHRAKQNLRKKLYKIYDK